jgi:hypothetical protein
MMQANINTTFFLTNGKIFVLLLFFFFSRELQGSSDLVEERIAVKLLIELLDSNH